MCCPTNVRGRAATWTTTCLALLALAMPSSAAEPVPPTRPVRVGTFDARAVAVAYYRSPMHQQRLSGAAAESEKAKEAGDQARAKRIDADLSAEQRSAHQQVFGNGPYDSLADRLAPVLADVAKATGVDVIASAVFYAAPGIETRDVTGPLLDALKADDKTRQVIQDLREQIRTGKYKPGDYRGGH